MKKKNQVQQEAGQAGNPRAIRHRDDPQVTAAKVAGIWGITGVLVGSLITGWINNRERGIEREQSRIEEVSTEVIEASNHFRSYWTVDWDGLSKLTYDGESNYTHDYRSATPRLAHYLESEADEAQRVSIWETWVDFQRAKTRFRLMTSKARMYGPTSVREALLNVDRAFEAAAEDLINTGYHSRAPVDSYNAMLPPKLFALERTLHAAAQK